MKSVLLGLAALAMTAGSVIAADDDKATAKLQDRDLRCVVVMSFAVGQAPEAKKPPLNATLAYYFGRLEARDPDIKIEPALREVMKGGLMPLLQNDSDRCTKDANKMGDRIKGVGEAFRPK